MPLWQKKDTNPKIRFRCMMESGDLVDEMADVVQNQVLAKKASASITNRLAVGLYYQTQEDAPPQWSEALLVETGIAVSPSDNASYMLQDTPRFFHGLRSGAVEIVKAWYLSATPLTVLFNVLGIVRPLGLSIGRVARHPRASSGGAAPAAEAEATIEATQAAPTPAEPLPGFDNTEPLPWFENAETERSGRGAGRASSCVR